MNRKQSTVFAGLLGYLAEVPEDEPVRYLLQVIGAQSQGKLLSVLSDCLAEIEKLIPEERPEVISALVAHFGFKPPAVETTPPTTDKPKGKLTNTEIVAIAKKHSIHPDTLRYRLEKMGMSLDQALTEPVKSAGARITKSKHSLPPGETLGTLAKKYNINRYTLAWRLKSGLSLEEALTTPVAPGPGSKRGEQ